MTISVSAKRIAERSVKYGSLAACNLDASSSIASIPSRIDSSDLDMFPSCVCESRFNVVALCRSRRDNLTWSARRKTCDGFAIVRRHTRNRCTTKIVRTSPSSSIELRITFEDIDGDFVLFRYVGCVVLLE